MKTAEQEAQEIFDKYFSHQWQVHKTTRAYKTIGMSRSAALYFSKKEVEALLSEQLNHVLEPMDVGRENFLLQVKKEIEKL